MANTAKNALPYPLGTVQPFVHLDIKSLAEAIDGRLLTVCTEATPSDTRPTGAARYLGAFVYCTDTKAYGMWDGSTWRMEDTSWVETVPTFSTSGSTAIMAPANRRCRAMRRGAEVTASMSFKWTALGTGEGLGDGFYLFSLPYSLASF